MKQMLSIRAFSTIGRQPSLRTRTLMGSPFRVTSHERKLKDKDLYSTHYFLQDPDSNDFLSPWHDIELVPSTLQNNHITGIIEIPFDTTAKLEVDLTHKHNPVVSDTRTN